MTDLKIPALSGSDAKFIATFIRFEFALKECKFFRSDRRSAEVDWSIVSAELDRSFFESLNHKGGNDFMALRDVV